MSASNPNRLKTQIVEHLRKVPIIQVACERVRLPRATFYRWRKQDNDFAKAVDEALTVGEQLMSDMAESQLLAAIKDKNLTAIIFWLKHHHARYATKVEVTAQLKHAPEELTPEQEAVVMKALELAALAPIKQQEIIEESTSIKEEA